MTKTDESSILGEYSEDGTSNGRISYRHAGGYYLQFIPGGQWIVSPNYIILIEIPVKFLVTYHFIYWVCQVIEFTVFLVNTENTLGTCCFQIRTEDYKGTNGGLIMSHCRFDCPHECTGIWQVGVDGSWKSDLTLGVTKQAG